MSLEVTGKLIYLSEIVSGTSKAGKDWQNITIVIETAEQYPKKVPIEIGRDELIKKVQSYELGQPLTVKINLDGREHNGRWYPKIIGWSL